MRSTFDTARDLASRRFVVNANLSSCVAEMSNFDADELGRIIANAVSKFLNRPGQNSENSTSAATQTQTSEGQVSIVCQWNFSVSYRYYFLLFGEL